jgi:metallophosphoesterase superfamily enzyme
MAMKPQIDYKKVVERIRELIIQGVKPEWATLSAQMDIPQASLRHILHHRMINIKHPRDIAATIKFKIDGENMQVLNNPKEGEKRTHIKDGQYDEYVSVSVKGQIRSADDLVRACKIDQKKYIIVDPEHRKWDVALKLKQKNGTDKLVIVPMYYVRVRTFPIHPEPIMPIIRPVEVTAQPVRPSPDRKSDLKRALIIPDVHVGFRRRLHTQELMPFHDRRVLDIALQIVADDWVDHIIFIGDSLDLAEFSTKFTPEPEFYFTTQPAIIEWAWWLASFREAAPSSIMDVYEGNHDLRLENMIVSYMRAAYGLRPADELQLPPSLSVERLLALHTMGIDYIKGYPDNYRWLNKNVLIRHGDVVRAGPGDSVKAVINKTTYTTIFGHIHRRELVSRRIKSRDGDVIQTAFCPGCACHIDGRVPGSKSDDQWQQGLGIVEYNDEKENLTAIAIEDGKAIYNGQMFTAHNHDKSIEKMLTSRLEKIK